MKDISGDDCIIGSVISEDGDYAFVSIEQKKDENFLLIEPHGDQSISGHGPITVERVDDEDPMEHPCGEFKSAWHNDLNHHQVKRFSCHLQGCPKCFRIWARRVAEKSAGYLYAFTRKYGRQIAHWVLSPDHGYIQQFAGDDDALWKALDDSLRAIMDTFSSFDDCVVSIIRHPMRKHCPVCGAKAEKEAFCKACNCEMTWYWSPHLHVNTDFRFEFARAVEYAGYELDKHFIFTQVAVAPDQVELANLIAYELGHALFVDGKQKQAIRYLAFCAKNHYRTKITKVRTEAGEPTIDDDGAVNNHTFYRLADSSVVEMQPGILRVKKYLGRVQYEKNVCNQRIPLMKTTYYFELVELGSRVNNRFLRTALPLKKLKESPCTEVWDTIAWRRRFLNIH